MARIKGVAIQSRLQFIESRFGSEGLERVLDRLPPEHRKWLTEPVLVSRWYPLALSEAILDAAETLFGRRDGALCREMGATSCRLSLQKLYRGFAAPRDTSHLALRLREALWKHYYDEGKLEARRLDEGAIEVELKNLAESTRWTCDLLVGYMEALEELWGHRHVTVTHARCRSRGAPSCVFSIRFEP